MTESAQGGFDRVARVYRVLEFLAFGTTLQRARLAHLTQLRSCRSILVLGDGDGRFLEALVSVATQAHVTSIDASAAMIALARQRVMAASAGDRVTFEQADALRLSWPPQHYDAVVTMFFLDCFSADDAGRLVAALARTLRPDGVWLFADFAIPNRGWARAYARACVSALYAFFRWRTGIRASALPPSEALLAAQGWRVSATREFRGGMIRSVAFAGPAAAALL